MWRHRNWRMSTCILSGNCAYSATAPKLEIPWQKLSDEALTAVIEEFVTREGTEYGARDYSLAEKVARVRAQLQDGRLGLDYDPDSGSCQLFVKR